ncbi:MAG: hypothetical protein ACHBN1_13165 [Heteroscytonema crispum UTEX LB 1556]
MPNPRGNPESLPPSKRQGEEPLTKLLTVRITESMHKQLKEATDDVAEYVREAIAEKLDKNKINDNK